MMSNGRVIKIPDDVYNALHELKFEMKKDTFGDVVKKLVEEHEEKEASA